MRDNNKVKSDLFQGILKDIEISRGSPLPFGATPGPGGINFSVFSRNSTSITLVLFLPGKDDPLVEIPLDPSINRTGDIWHVFVSDIVSSVEYSYRADRIPNENPELHKYDPNVFLLDPFARAISGGELWGEISVDQKKLLGEDDLSPLKRRHRSLMVDYDFDWEDDKPLNVPLSETVIYELHTRGFTRRENSGVKFPGTFLGLVEKIPYLKELGITAIELLPVNEFEEIDTDRINPLTGKRLFNYWGYHPISFFAPNASYAHDNYRGGQVREFKTMVKAMHAAGIEVILDVVFNHTAEGDERGKTFSYRGLDNSTYYLTDPKTNKYLNFSGCGNTLNCNHPVVRDMILDCLRYWVVEMRVDGFRFDLASILGRGRDGEVLANPPLLERIAADPVLANTKLIAEAWDAAGLYQVGTFATWGRWAEWNGKFRDDVRKFVKSDIGMTSTLAKRFLGSEDIYGTAPYHSINFVTCHDGFTLADLVSYDRKHNEINGEDSKDGIDDNCSWNCGWEGNLYAAGIPDADAQNIKTIRLRQIKNFAAVLLLSRGVPMILAGDEIGRTQLGNNNSYCQDNEISWMDWSGVSRNAALLRFFKLTIKLRKSHPAFRCGSFSYNDKSGDFSAAWHGVKLHCPDFSGESRSLALQISCNKPEYAGLPDLYLVFNSYWEALLFELPTLADGRKWRKKVDTSLDSPYDIADEGGEILLENRKEYLVGPRSVIVLLGK